MPDASAPPPAASVAPAAAAPVAIKSRLLKQLDKDIAAATSPMASAAARAKRAMLLARHGAVGEAREALTALHQLSFQHPHPEIGAWLHMAEGLMSYYNGFVAQQAWDRIQRAHAIAGSSPALVEVRVLAAAWLSQLAFIRHDPVALVDYAQRCLGEALPEHNVARPAWRSRWAWPGTTPATWRPRSAGTSARAAMRRWRATMRRCRR